MSIPSCVPCEKCIAGNIPNDKFKQDVELILCGILAGIVSPSRPGGVDTNVQYNNSGLFGGDNNFVWNKVSRYLGINTSPLANLHVYGALYTDIVALFQASPSQASNTTEWQNYSGVVRAFLNNLEASTQFQLGNLNTGGTPATNNGINLDTSLGGIGSPSIRLFYTNEIDVSITCSSFDGLIINSGLTVAGFIRGVTDFLAQTLTARDVTNPYVRLWKTGVAFFDWSAATSGYLKLLDTSGNTLLKVQGLDGSGGSPANGFISIGDIATALAQLHVQSSLAASPTLAIQGAGSQSENLTNWLDSSANVLASMSELGSFACKNIAAAIVTKTSTYTAADDDFTILGDATGGAFTVNLPTAATSAGRIYNIKKIDASINAVTVDGNASETIDGATTRSLTIQYQTLSIQCDGSNWFII